MKGPRLLAYVSLHQRDGSSINETQFINALSKRFESVYVFSPVSLKQIILRRASKPVIPPKKNVKVVLLPALPLPAIFLPIILLYYMLIGILSPLFIKVLNLNAIYIRDRYMAISILLLKPLVKARTMIKFGGFTAAELRSRMSEFFRILSPLETFVDVYLLRKGDVILVSSLAMKRYLGRVLNINREVLLCPAGVDLDKIRKIADNVNVMKDKVRIGFLGSLTWWQGVDILAEALTIVKERVPNIELLIVGDGPMREHVARICEKHRIPYAITGFVSHEESLRYLKSFDVLVLPRLRTSVTENTIPIKMIEAWALGVPIIVTRHRVLVEMRYRDREHLIYCEPNPSSVAESILSLLSNDDLRRTMAAKGFELAQNYDYNKTAEKILNIVINSL